MKKTITALALALFAPAGAAQTVAETGYVNMAFGYRVAAPEGYTAAPIVAGGTELGVTFTKGTDRIFVRATPVDHAYAPLSFDEYVKVAGRSEVAEGSVLLDIEPLVTETGNKGYRTVWARAHDDSVHNKNTSSLAPKSPKKAPARDRTFYYMPISLRAQLNGEFVKAVSIVPLCATDNCALVENDALDVALSYRPSGRFENFFDHNDNGKSFDAETGHNIVIELPSNPTTGFTWQFEELDKTMFEVVKDQFITSATDLAGAGGLHWWELKPLKPGRAKIALKYARSWESAEPADEMILHFKVTEADDKK
ncbi:MAG: protease inhibitor I42 family protein [Elusimicrobiaceae bacterium]|nr:protease inhibitor I42 family protein [Elusimicrobiaceae bacterium]